MAIVELLAEAMPLTLSSKRKLMVGVVWGCPKSSLMYIRELVIASFSLPPMMSCLSVNKSRYWSLPVVVLLSIWKLTKGLDMSSI